MESTSIRNREVAATIEILHSITDEAEGDKLLEKGERLEQILSQTPDIWFRREDGNAAESGIGEACIKMVRSLVSCCLSPIGMTGEEAVDVWDNEEPTLKERSQLAHVALTLIRILLSKLLSRQQRAKPVYEDKQHQPDGDKLTNEKRESHHILETEQRSPDSSILDCGRTIGVAANEGKERSFQYNADRVEGGHFSIPPRHGNDGRFCYPVGRDGLDEGRDELNAPPTIFTRDVLKSVIGPCIAMCVAHCEPSPWATEATVRAANALLSEIMSYCSCSSVSRLLQGDHYERQQPGMAPTKKRPIPKGAFGPAMVELKKHLTRTDWKKCPAAKKSFEWLLPKMKHPYLGEHLEHCLPPSLLFVDNYKVENKIIGIQCLQHIIDNVDPTEMRWYGRGEVVYEALQPLLYNCNPHLIGALYPCLLGVLSIVERDPKKRDDKSRKPGRYDKVLEIILTSMEGEQRIAVRRANAGHLSVFIEAMGITILWHMKRLVRVIVSYLEASDGPEETGRILILRILQAVVLQAWPRMTSHCVELMKSLLRILVDLSRETCDITPEGKESMRNECVKCLVLLKRCSSSVVQDAVEKLLSSNLTDAFLKDCFERVLAE